MESVVGRAFGIQSLLSGADRRPAAETRDSGTHGEMRHPSGLNSERGRIERGTR